MTTTSQSTCYLHAIGTAVPEHWLDAEGTVQLFRPTCTTPRAARLLQSVVRLSGVHKRHLAILDTQQADGLGESFYRPPVEQPQGPGMAVRTAMFEKVAGPLVCRALRAFEPQTLAAIDTLVTASCTHASSPGLEMPVLTQTPVPRSVHRWNLGFMGCSAALAGLRLICQTARPGREALVVACELGSLHFQYTDKVDQITANVLFADGAAAATVSTRPSAVRIIDCRCAALPESAGQMVWFAADHGLQLILARELPDTLAAIVPGAVSRFLQDNETSIGRIDHWLVHPGGPQILDSVEQSLGLPADALQISREVLRQYGNMSSPTILFILQQLLESHATGRVLAMAFGPGLTIEMVLLEIAPRV